ncbi:hypothetical protein [Paenibacillus wynnii]|uniref:Uncharacterized protein n=1 Tax=Paenibacillus wynnii TaxID=268407 RepID=A0A098M6D9_9BACL|nr:hypothetical protein [Paenibacillus wynnii]KGE17581.1 hypothetical protein PWYN_23605 [Paenibacillus wynnii]
MSSWKEELKTSVASNIQSRSDIKNALINVLKEIQSELGYGVDAKPVGISPADWAVKIQIPSIGVIEFVITHKEISSAGGYFDDVGQWNAKFPDNLENALKEIVSSKIIETIEL